MKTTKTTTARTTATPPVDARWRSEVWEPPAADASPAPASPASPESSVDRDFEIALNERILAGLEAHPEEPFRDPWVRVSAFIDGRFGITVEDAKGAALELAEREEVADAAQ